MTDTIQDGQKHRVPIIFLAGPIKHWWTCWGSDEHRLYLFHRDWVRRTLIDAGYLTYAPWDAFKGSWDERAQAINEQAIAISDLFINMTPPGIPAEETELEQSLAWSHGVPTTHAIPGLTKRDLLDFLDSFRSRCVRHA